MCEIFKFSSHSLKGLKLRFMVSKTNILAQIGNYWLILLDIGGYWELLAFIGHY